MPEGGPESSGLTSKVYFLSWIAALLLTSTHLVTYLEFQMADAAMTPVVLCLLIFCIAVLVITGFLVIESIDPRTSLVLALLASYIFWTNDLFILSFSFMVVVSLSFLRTILTPRSTSSSSNPGVLFTLLLAGSVGGILIFGIPLIIDDVQLGDGTPPPYVADSTSIMTSEEAFSYRPSLTEDGGGTIHAVWLTSNASNDDGLRAVMHATWSAGEWSDPSIISEEGLDADAVTITASGEDVHVVWRSHDPDLNTTSILHRHLTTGGWSDEASIITPSNNPPGPPAAVAGPDGTLHVAWSQQPEPVGPDSRFVIIYRTLNDELWSETQMVSQNADDHSLMPAICSTGYNNADLIWMEFSANTSDQGYRLLHQRLPINEWNTENIVHESSEDRPSSLSVSSNRLGRMDIVWHEEYRIMPSTTSSRIMHIQGTNAEFDEPRMRGNSLSLSLDPIVYHDSEDNLHIAWSDSCPMPGSGPGLDVFHIMMSRQGYALEERVISVHSPHDSLHPVLLVDGQRTLHAVWQETSPLTGGESHIMHSTSSDIPDWIPPVAITGGDKVVGQGDTVSLDGSGSTDNVGVTNWSWAFRHDGEMILLYGENTSFEFYELGVHNVTLWVRDASGNQHSSRMTVTVEDTVPPFADAGPDQERAVVRFNGSGSHDDLVNVGSGIANWTWSFHDGVEDVVLHGVSPSHRFTVIGSYAVTLNVTDVAGNQAQDVMWVNVSDVEPPVAVAGTDATVDQNTTLTFDGSSSHDDVAVTEWRWQVDDVDHKIVHQGVTFDHTFLSVGEFNVTLTVWDSHGNHGNDTITVTVVDSVDPVAVAGQDRVLMQGLNATFNASESHDDVVGSGSGLVNYTWEFKRGDTSLLVYGMEVDVNFEQPGSYTANLTVRDAAGREGHDIIRVHVVFSGGDHSLQDAVDGALPGETILIGDGQHIADITIMGPLDLRSYTSGGAVLMGNVSQAAIEVMSDGVNITGFVITGPQNATGVMLTGVNGCNISGNTIKGLATGIHLNQSDGNIIAQNSIHNNIIGILIDASDDNILMDNRIEDNARGMDLLQSQGNLLRSNDIGENGLGVRMDGCSGNIVHSNIFRNNTLQAWDDGSNRWNLTRDEGGGNSWCDYQGSYGGEGFGITAYAIAGGGNMDLLPLMAAPIDDTDYHLYIGIAVVATVGFTFLYGEAAIETIKRMMKGINYYRKARKARKLLRKLEKERRKGGW